METDMPFDMYGDLEDAYDKADLNGDVEIVETLDAFGLWNEHPKCSSAFMRTVWNAVQGDVEAQTTLGCAFYRPDDSNEKRRRHRWNDNPDLAIYWFNLAAEEGCADAQNYLACHYCPELQPAGAPKIGRFARHWLEQAADQKHTLAMNNLAYCLKCGKCACCDRDIARAKALEAEARELENQKED